MTENKVEGHWETDDGAAVAAEYVKKDRADLCMGSVSDFALANDQYMVSRDDLRLIAYQTAVKERIRWLSAQLAKCRTRALEASQAEEPFAWADGVSWHKPAHRAVMASVNLGRWMSAALDDPKVCEEMKADIREWFSAGEPMETLCQVLTTPTRIEAAQQEATDRDEAEEYPTAWTISKRRYEEKQKSYGTKLPPMADKPLVEQIIDEADALTTPTRIQAAGDGEKMKVLLPPASVDQEFLDGWISGQQYLILNYGSKEEFDEAVTTPTRIEAAHPQEAAGDGEKLRAAMEKMKLVSSWLCNVAACDMDEIVADGGVTAAMVVRKEAEFQQERARSAIADIIEALATPPQPPADLVERTVISKEWCMRMAKLEGDAEIGAGMPDHPLRTEAALSRPTLGREDDMKDAIIAAYEAGALAVHENWQEDRDPDFTEAAHDYAANAILALIEGEG